MEDFDNSLAYARCHEFPTLTDTVYLDHAGATLVCRSQLEAHHKDIISNIYGNPHGGSASSQLSTDSIDQIRYRILQYLGTSADEYSVIFTSGCTAALKLVAETFDYYSNQTCVCENPALPTESQNNSCCDSSDVNDTDGGHVHGQGPAPHHCYPETSKTSCVCSKQGSLSYLMDNHTSVLGMREYAIQKAGRVQCLDCDDENNVSVMNVLHLRQDSCSCGNHLFAYPAQSNFSGRKYPLSWISLVKDNHMDWQRSIKGCGSRSSQCQGRYYTVLDAASLVSSSPLNLGCVNPDFVALSFYKMFGFPTGLGALLVKNDSAHLLKKTYFGGGTVAVSLAIQPFHVSRSSLSEKFEDGTVSFLDIISLRHGFEAIQNLAGGIHAVSRHTFNLAQYFHHNLASICHSTGTRLAEIYCDGGYEDIQKQGAIISFNLLRANGEYVGFSEVDKLAQLYNIHVRTGCFCNIGACQKYLGMDDDQIKQNFDAGHVCGDEHDLIDGKPTGAVRASFGYMSTLEDAQKCLQFIVDCFLSKMPQPVFWEKKKRENQSHSNNSNIFPVDFNAVLAEERTTQMKYVGTRTKQSANISTASTSDVTGSCDDLHYQTEKETIEEKYETEELKIRKNVSEISDPYVECSKLVKQEVQLSPVIQTCDEPQAGDAVIFKPWEGRHISDIFLYPVKSCAAFKVRQWPVCDRGLLYDREWMVVTESGITMSQKRESRLCLLKPSINLKKHLLILEFPGLDTMHVSLDVKDQQERETSLCNSKVCGDRVQSFDCGSDVADWLSEALCRPRCRLIRQSIKDYRSSKLKNVKASDTPTEDKSRLSLANESQYLLISRDSTATLYEKIYMQREQGDTQECIDIDNLVDRFRGNLVVSGCEPFEEDTWNNVQIGNLKFKSQGICTRCQMVCLDQQTGERSREPLKTLAVWRGTRVPFGIHLRGTYCRQTSSPESAIGDLCGTDRPAISVDDPVFIT